MTRRVTSVSWVVGGGAAPMPPALQPPSGRAAAARDRSVNPAGGPCKQRINRPFPLLPIPETPGGAVHVRHCSCVISWG
ncbi:unnamed protein product [Caenorhabditis auriculariae]|uniref:Uncharacterized protein n=1 Tax=Caenorhabditis auriculariae TaxID=2777116 RepID=A0A8S1HGB7_9PELO|nr:unnamed protein product [Caenorhabditis auriculariae]